MLDSVITTRTDTTTIRAFREQSVRGEALPLDADPTPIRVCVPGSTGRLAVTVAPDARRGHVAVLSDLDAPPGAPELPHLLYLALQRARIWRCSLVSTGEPRIFESPMRPSLAAPGGRRAEMLDLAMHRLFVACTPAARAQLVEGFVPELLATLDRRARSFADNAWCRAVREQRLERAQYVVALANTHQYVRYTPRLLARAIAVTEDESLRDHFYRHLRGEQRHDRLLESDLRYLDADVDFVVHAMVPAPTTQAFMTLQESMITFHQDPARFLGAPFVAEGIAARIEPEFFHHLHANILRWGYSRPEKATRFLTSHALADGGDDGHFNRNVAVVARLLRDDTAQQRFLAVMHQAADAFTRSYDSYADHYDLSF